MGDNDRQLLLARHRRWFKPHIIVDGLAVFPTDQIDVLVVDKPGTWHTKFLIGRGPVEIPRGEFPLLFFEHGEEIYPTFTVPSTSPVGAGLFNKSRSRVIEVAESEALLLIDAAALIEIPYELMSETNELNLDAAATPGTELWQFVSEQLYRLARASSILAGSFALAQHPLVWTTLESDRLIALVTIGSEQEKLPDGTVDLAAKFVESPDNWIPFRLDPTPVISEGRLVDAVATQWADLVGLDRVGDALIVLGEAIHETHIGSRFLQLFWILDLLASESDGIDPRFREEVAALGELVIGPNPEFRGTWQRMKEKSLSPSAAEKISAYTKDLGTEMDVEVLGDILDVRNDLSHGRQPDSRKLAAVELDLRLRIWVLLELELERAGINLRWQDGANES